MFYNGCCLRTVIGRIFLSGTKNIVTTMDGIADLIKCGTLAINVQFSIHVHLKECEPSS